MVRFLEILGIQEIYLNVIKAVYSKTIVNIIRNIEKSKQFY